MDKQQKQIEEMAKRECGCYIVEQDICALDRKICNCDCTDYRKAKRFYDYFISIGYQKISEDSVVLSKEEWNKLMGDTYTSKEVDEIVAYKERMKTREVSRNILTKLADDFSGLDGMDIEYPLNRVKIYAKEYGVEVE